MERDFENRQVVVTGGTGELGRAVVAALEARGAVCHVPRHRDVDLADETAVRTYYDSVPVLWASVHCAGGFEAGPFEQSSAESFERMMRINARTAFLCCRGAVARMGREGGRIVNVVARPALDPSAGAGMIAYTMSKAAVAALTVALARELRDRGIRVNAVAPSILDTPTNRRAMPDADPAAWPSVEEVARVVALLVSPSNRAVGGALVPVYGSA